MKRLYQKPKAETNAGSGSHARQAAGVGVDHSNPTHQLIWIVLDGKIIAATGISSPAPIPVTAIVRRYSNVSETEDAH